MAEIAKLLSASLAAHHEALRLRRDGRASDARLALLAAHRLRLQAHESDPGHADPAWADEDRATPKGRDTHTEMMAFYQPFVG